MRHKIAAGLIVISIVAGGGFGFAWYHEHRADRTLVVASGPQQSEFHVFASALATVVENREPRLRLHVIETYGSDENVTLLADDTAQLALVAGTTDLEPQMSVVDFLFPEVVHLLVRTNLDIARVPDLRGNVVGLPPAGSTSRDLFWRLIRHYGLGPSDLKIMTIEPKEASAALRDELIDAYFVVSAIGSAWIGNLLSEAPAKLLPVDQAAALSLSLPALRAGVIPKGTYNGAGPLPSEDLPSVALQTLLVTTPSVAADDIYKIVRVLREARQELIAIDLSAALIERIEDPLKEGLPINAGATAYFRRDQPLFVVRYAETLGFLLSAAVLTGSALWQVKLRSDRRAKNRADNYNTQVIDLAEQAENATDRDELEAIQRRLLVIFRSVFSDLDEDRISAAALQGFTLAWYTAAQIVEHRRASLADTGEAAKTRSVASSRAQAEPISGDGSGMRGALQSRSYV